MAEKKMSFEQSVDRLQEIVAALEKGDAPLADSLKLFEEGTKLVSSCTAMLEQAEQKVVKLVKSADETPTEEPFFSQEEEE
ncbi:MAG TPA: exodeoxyribonuclease VII small subunit [Firmicutes bacterium]|nr:exodeoxyribonuclease VII small subunit [Bacillota bacterium]